jgi:hypothetical protein
MKYDWDVGHPPPDHSIRCISCVFYQKQCISEEEIRLSQSARISL